MTTAGHAAVGYFIAKSFIHAGIIPPALEPHAVTFAIIAANIPDLDGLAYWRVLRHRIGSPLHIPIFWFVSTVPFILYQTMSGQPKLLGFTLLAFLCILSHLICDTVDYSYGIAWLWPFSNKHIHFWKKSFPVAPSIKTSLRNYTRNPILFAELVLSVSAYITSRGGR
jgi:membrane-bound metal-dependent hydrolase YbcI (DUF457 family)